MPVVRINGLVRRETTTLVDSFYVAHSSPSIIFTRRSTHKRPLLFGILLVALVLIAIILPFVEIELPSFWTPKEVAQTSPEPFASDVAKEIEFTSEKPDEMDTYNPPAKFNKKDYEISLWVRSIEASTYQPAIHATLVEEHSVIEKRRPVRVVIRFPGLNHRNVIFIKSEECSLIPDDFDISFEDHVNNPTLLPNFPKYDLICLGTLQENGTFLGRVDDLEYAMQMYVQRSMTEKELEIMMFGALGHLFALADYFSRYAKRNDYARFVKPFISRMSSESSSCVPSQSFQFHLAELRTDLPH